MKLQLLAILTLCVSLIHCFTIPYQGMSDLEIANYVVEHFENKNNQGDIIYPQVGDVWHIGEKVNVTFKPDSQDQTVSIFFFNKTDTLAGGPLNETFTVFNFTVPKEAYSGSNSTSLLLAVRRQNHYLQTVDSVVLQVL